MKENTAEGLVWGVEELPNSLNPILPLNATAWAIKDLIFDGLTNRNIVNGVPIYEKALASEIVQQRNLRHYSVILRDSKFHDGRKVTAEDVIFTINTILERKNECELRGRWEDLLQSIERVSSSEIIFKFKKKVPYYAAEQFLSFKILPHIFLGKKLNIDLRYGTLERQFIREPIGNGPYKFKYWETGDRVELEKNEEYYGEYPKIKNITATLIHDEEKRIKFLINDRINFLLNVSPRFNYRLEREKLPNFEYYPFNYFAIAYNVDNPKFKSNNIRKALCQAINKEEMVAKILGDRYEASQYVNIGPFPWNALDGYQFRNRLRHDKEKAKGILRRSIIADEGINLVFSSELGALGWRIALSYQEMLSDIGITVNILERPRNNFRNQVFVHKIYDAALIKFEGFTKRYNIAPIYHSESLLNYPGYRSSEFDDLLLRWEGMTTMEEKVPVSLQIHNYLSEISIYTYLFTLPQKAFYSSNLLHVSIDVISTFSSIEQWTLAKIRT